MYNIQEFVDIYSAGELYFVLHNGYAYLFSNYHFGDKEFDYGIYDRENIETLAKAEDGLEYLPDIFAEERIDIGEEIDEKIKPLHFTEIVKIIPKAKDEELKYIRLYNERYGD